MKRIFIFAAAFAVLLSQSGCATLVALQMKNKLPQFEAKEISVQLSWAGVQVGIIEAKGLIRDKDGNLVAETFHEEIGTPTGGVKITGTGVKVGPPPPKT